MKLTFQIEAANMEEAADIAKKLFPKATVNVPVVVEPEVVTPEPAPVVVTPVVVEPVVVEPEPDRKALIALAREHIIGGNHVQVAEILKPIGVASVKKVPEDKIAFVYGKLKELEV